MSLKLKVLGLGLLAIMATSAFAVTNASGTAAGHFVHHGSTNNAWVTAHEGAESAHNLKFYHLKSGTHEKDTNPIHCKTSTYVGTAAAKTVTSIELRPTYTECTTEDGTKLLTPPVDVNGCAYTFSSQGARKHGTVNIDCPAGKTIEITHPNCTIRIPAQTAGTTLTEGVTFAQSGNELTATVTVNTITGHYEGGICIFLGTAQKFRMEGSVTVKAFEHLGGTFTSPKEGAQIAITST